MLIDMRGGGTKWGHTRVEGEHKGKDIQERDMEHIGGDIQRGEMGNIKIRKNKGGRYGTLWKDIQGKGYGTYRE